MQSTCVLQIGTDTKYHTKKCISELPKSNVNILSPSQPVYYKLVLNLNIVPRNVYQGNQRAMLR